MGNSNERSHMECLSFLGLDGPSILCWSNRALYSRLTALSYACLHSALLVSSLRPSWPTQHPYRAKGWQVAQTQGSLWAAKSTPVLPPKKVPPDCSIPCHCCSFFKYGRAGLQVWFTWTTQMKELWLKLEVPVPQQKNPHNECGYFFVSIVQRQWTWGGIKWHSKPCHPWVQYESQDGSNHTSLRGLAAVQLPNDERETDSSLLFQKQIDLYKSTAFQVTEINVFIW